MNYVNIFVSHSLIKNFEPLNFERRKKSEKNYNRLNCERNTSKLLHCMLRSVASRKIRKTYIVMYTTFYNLQDTCVSKISKQTSSTAQRGILVVEPHFKLKTRKYRKTFLNHTQWNTIIRLKSCLEKKINFYREVCI